ncbi:hypothetical protein [Cellulomonas xiejunii]|uniref:Uncharacterized protein n=1 Tax=Cellulomonas xiejunii TaxID=2968083 RepID=A0ABY5KR63_9CELL|nr:hypothetical protein [Cellulomonas xiejunii]MCC2322157.1 hypothetical protein [Cellulomonas xiejunii]MCC2323200.1 hypothetical protein [Cellulomonas xiejunii]UUI72213.1 hypothetical protein NP048_01725 [Cellulomonas xiejunii]
MSHDGSTTSGRRLRRPSASAAGTAALLALAGVVLGLAGVVGLLTLAGRGGVAAVATTVLLLGLAPALASLSLVVLARDVGLVAARGALQAAVASTAAWTLAALAALSWAVAFDQTDAGAASTPFAEAFLPLLGAAVATGAVALLPLMSDVLRSVRPAVARRAAVAALAVGGAVVAGAAALAPGSVLACATVLLLACGRTWLRERQLAALVDSVHLSVPSAPTLPVGVASRPDPTVVPHRRLVVVLAAVSGALTLPAALYALAAPDPADPAWLPAALAGLPAMNAGLAVGALTALPLVVAAGLAATRWWGRRALVMTVMVALALVVRGVAAAMGPEGEAPSALLFSAALLAGVAGAVPLVGRLPGPAVARWALVVVVGAAVGWLVALPMLAVLPLAAPLVAVVLIVLVTRRPRGVALAPAPS